MPSAHGVVWQGSGLKGYENGNSKAEKGSPTSMEKKDDIRKNGGIIVGDYFLRTEGEMVEFALKKFLEDQKLTKMKRDLLQPLKVTVTPHHTTTSAIQEGYIYNDYIV